MPPVQPADAPPTPGFELMAAVASGDVHTVRALLAAQPTPPLRRALANFRDYDLRTPLHVACSEGLSPVARVLLAGGADPAATDRFGASCVRDAMRHGRLEVLRLLVQCNAPFPEGGRVAYVDPAYVLGRDLVFMAGMGDVQAVRQLVCCFSPNVNYANADGRTALHIAVVRSDPDMARYLLEAGADMHRLDRRGMSPAKEARRGSKEIRAVFGVESESESEVEVGADGEMEDDLAAIVREAAAFAVC